MRRLFFALLSLCFVSCLSPLLACHREPPRPDLALLVTIDTLRADHLGSYGHERAQTPHLDRIVAAQVQTLDLFPTLLEAAGIAIPEATEGHSLMPLVRGEVDSLRSFSFAETTRASCEIESPTTPKSRPGSIMS